MQASRPIWSQDSNLAIIAETRSKLNSPAPILCSHQDDTELEEGELSTLDSLHLDDDSPRRWNETVVNWV